MKNRTFKFIRKQQHQLYVEKRVIELRNNIVQQACKHGTVDVVTRKLYLKYNGYLRKLNG